MAEPDTQEGGVPKMNLNINELDMLPAIEATGDGPELFSACCTQCWSSMAVFTNGCEW